AELDSEVLSVAIELRRIEGGFLPFLANRLFGPAVDRHRLPLAPVVVVERGLGNWGAHALPPRRAPKTKSLQKPSARAFATSRRTRFANSSANSRRWLGVPKCGVSDAVAIRQLVSASIISPVLMAITLASVTSEAFAIAVMNSSMRRRRKSSSYEAVARAEGVRGETVMARPWGAVLRGRRDHRRRAARTAVRIRAP